MRHKEPSKWLAGATFDGGLVVPAQPGGGAADLRLTSEHVELMSVGHSAYLRWPGYRSALRSPADVADTRAISPWSSGRGGLIGIGLAVDGGYVDSTAPIRRAAQTWRNRINRFLQSGVVVPLCAVDHISAAVDADRDVMEVLCTLVVDRPDVRRHLEDRSRVERLLADLRSNRPVVPPFRAGVRRATTEVLTAMRLLGFEHRFYGRPLPDDELAGEDSVVATLLDRVRSNPYAQGVEIDDAVVRSIVERYYLDVEPWPVQALIEA